MPSRNTYHITVHDVLYLVHEHLARAAQARNDPDLLRYHYEQSERHWDEVYLHHFAEEPDPVGGVPA